MKFSRGAMSEWPLPQRHKIPSMQSVVLRLLLRKVNETIEKSRAGRNDLRRYLGAMRACVSDSDIF